MLNNILATFTKGPIPFYQKTKTIGQTIILLKPKYYLAKMITLCSKPKTIPWKNIFSYTTVPNSWEI